MKCIDTHQHFWKYNSSNHSWINDDMAKIRRDFLPSDLKPILKANNVDACIAIQTDQTDEETNFLIEFSSDYSFIAGVVGWIDLCADNINENLDKLSDFKIVKGFRHILQAEHPEFMLQPNFKRGIASLTKHNYSYDLLITPKHLKAAIELTKSFPNQRFVIDHIAKPDIKNQVIDDWAEDIYAIAKQSNVYCKVSGLVTEADFNKWVKKDFKAYLDIVVDAFGIERLMFGSDWPVCLVAASYKNMKKIVDDYFNEFSTTEKEKLYAENAIRFYQL